MPLWFVREQRRDIFGDSLIYGRFIWFGCIFFLFCFGFCSFFYIFVFFILLFCNGLRPLQAHLIFKTNYCSSQLLSKWDVKNRITIEEFIYDETRLVNSILLWAKWKGPLSLQFPSMHTSVSFCVCVFARCLFSLSYKSCFRIFVFIFFGCGNFTNLAFELLTIQVFWIFT